MRTGLWAALAQHHSLICSERTGDTQAHRLRAWVGGGPWPPVGTDQRAEMQKAAPLSTTVAQGCLGTHRRSRDSLRPSRYTKHLLLAL